MKTQSVTHTPGPWKYEYHEIWGNHKNIAEIHETRSIFLDGEPEANARLIASAPELLGALKVVQGLIDAMNEECMSSSDRDMTMIAIRDTVDRAITKAEGR